MQRLRSSLPPLSTLRAFEAAVRLGSFKAAAEDLRLTQSAISHQIHALETHFRRKLFLRVGNKLLLTRDGEAYGASIQKAFSEMSRAGEGLLGKSGSDIVRVSASPSFAAFAALPHIEKLKSMNGSLEVRLEARNTNVDFGAESIDAAIQVGPPLDRQLSGHRVFRSKLVPLVHPELCDRHGPIKTERDIARLPLIELNNIPGLWTHWFRRVDPSIGVPDLVLSSDSLLAALQMAESGVGAVLAPLPLVAPLVSSGRLKMLVKPRTLPEAPDFHLVYRTEDATTARIKSIRRWVEEIAATLERQSVSCDRA
ncbi:LysR substrate-binding domain-containing protein [Bradyrhizobium australafricanum]|uniref:LysR substrate-binding domain-containing protein n=1 Tax=Bradyrhizobium australafricanum TaxID=2821406 RepID=UPI001CE24AB3|nr:LysR substrate-binding domain-containing protein [Bradyrhizobium australafricanum]MCA6100497.1 LysR family transcriptional regulator [Bradyrhizobium australafricanum]